MALNFFKKKDDNMDENYQEENIVSDDIYKEYEPQQDSNMVNNGMENNNNNNQVTYHEKQYNSGFLDSHTKVTAATAVSKTILVLFYALGAVIVVVVVLMILTDKYQFYFKNDKVLISQGSSYQLELTPKNIGSFDYLNYNYKVADTSVATVDEFGTIKAVGNGTTDLKVSMKYGLVSKKITITTEEIAVSDIVLKVSKKDKLVTTSKLDMVKNETVTLHAFANDRDDMNLTVDYSSSNPSVATVDEFGNITAKKAGNAVITGTRDGVSSSVTVNVSGSQSSSSSSSSNNKVIQSISFSTGSISIRKGASHKLTLNVNPSSLAKSNFTWSSSNGNVSVDSNGRVTGKNVGESVITAKSSNGKTATITVKVTNETVGIKGITLNSNSVSIKAGNAYQLTAKINPSNATEREIVWSTSDQTIATVTDSGLVKGVKAGTTTITVKSKNGSVSASCKVTVTAQSSTSTKLTGVDIGIVQTTKYVGESLQLTAKLTPSNASVKKITWTSSDTSVATVSSNGVVSMKKAGTVTITVNVDGIKSSGTIIVKDKTTPKPTSTAKPTPTVAPATNKYFKVSTTSVTAKKGEKKTFTITISNAAGSIKVKTSDAAVATVDNNTLWFDGVDSSGKEKADVQTITINANKAGSATITVSTDDLSSYDTLESINKSYSITVKVS